MINTQCLLVAIVTAFVAVVSVDVRDAFLPVIICMILLSGFFVFPLCLVSLMANVWFCVWSYVYIKLHQGLNSLYV